MPQVKSKIEKSPRVKTAEAIMKKADRSSKQSFKKIDRKIAAAKILKGRIAPKADAHVKSDSRMTMKALMPHPLAEMLPAMTEAEYEALKDDIGRNGQMDDVILVDGLILDGRHRHRSLTELGRATRVSDLPAGMSPIQYVTSKASHRNMSESQKAAAAVLIEAEMAKDAAKRMAAGVTVEDPAVKGKASEQAARLFGVSARYVEAAKAVFNADAKVFKEVFEGRLPVTRATSQIRRAAKSTMIRKLHKAIEAGDPAVSPWVINHGDSIELMAKSEPRSTSQPSLIIADPPYNEGLDYGDGAKADDLSEPEYVLFMDSWLEQCHRHLTSSGTLIVIINDEWAAHHVVCAKEHGFHLRNWIKWYETFGVNCSNKFNRTSRHILYFTKSTSKFTFNAEAFSRPSDRQLKYADPRANPSGKLWDDVWVGIPRLVSGDERQPEFKTQLPLGLILPLVEGLSLPGETVFDPFSGSGTTVAAAYMSGRRGFGIEKNEERVKASRVRLSSIVPTEVKSPKLG